MADQYDELQGAGEPRELGTNAAPYGQYQAAANAINDRLDAGMQRMRSRIMTQQASEATSISDRFRK